MSSEWFISFLQNDNILAENISYIYGSVVDRNMGYGQKQKLQNENTIMSLKQFAKSEFDQMLFLCIINDGPDFDIITKIDNSLSK